MKIEIKNYSLNNFRFKNEEYSISHVFRPEIYIGNLFSDVEVFDELETSIFFKKKKILTITTYSISESVLKTKKMDRDLLNLYVCLSLNVSYVKKNKIKYKNAKKISTLQDRQHVQIPMGVSLVRKIFKDIILEWNSVKTNSIVNSFFFRRVTGGSIQPDKKIKMKKIMVSIRYNSNKAMTSFIREMYNKSGVDGLNEFEKYLNYQLKNK